MTKTPPTTRPRPTVLSIVIPVYCNEPSLVTLHARLSEVAAQYPAITHEIVFVDDGSEDASFQRLEQLAAADPHVRVARLSRNFGSHNACLAGMSIARGDCIAIIAADLQEPPDLPWRLLEQWSPETPVVLATRTSRDDEWSRILFARVYYRVMRRVAFPHFPAEGFDCFLVDRRVVDQILALNERNISLNGLVLWTGFNFTRVDYDRLARPFGRSRWTVAKRVKLFIDSVVAFSYAPVRAMSATGVSVGVIGLLYAAFIVLRKMTTGENVSGWSSLMAVLLVVAGLQLIALGVLGEYVWRALDAARGRPNFIIAETRNLETAAVPDPDAECRRPVRASSSS